MEQKIEGIIKSSELDKLLFEYYVNELDDNQIKNLIMSLIREFAQSQAVEVIDLINMYKHPYPRHAADIQQNHTIELCEQVIKQQFDLPL